MKRIRIHSSRKRIIACLFFCFFATSLADETSFRYYALPDHGSFELQVPKQWGDEVRQAPNRLPPTIVFRPKGEKTFEILLTPIWPASKDTSVLDSEKIEKIVRQNAQKAEQQSVESRVMVKELRGASGTGYYFFATDRAPSPGEYKYMTQGMIRVGDLVVTFTVLTHDANSADANNALNMLRGAKQAK